MPNPVAAIIGSTVGSAAVGVVGAKKAADAQKDATAAASASAATEIELYEKIFEQQREDQTPWREAGGAAIQEISTGLQEGRFTMDDWQFSADPGYEFRRREGEKVLDRSAAVNGGFMSGDRVKAGLEYNQNFASNEFGKAYAREAGARADDFNFLNATAGGGQVAVQSTNANAAAMGQQVGGAMRSNANFAAQGAANQGQIAQNMYGNIAGTANQGIENFLTYKMGGFG